MNCVRFIILLMFISSILLLNSAHTTTPKNGAYILQIRTGDHSDFRRIVFEGPETIISKGGVKQKGPEITVRFSDMHFTLKKTDPMIAPNVDKDAVTLLLKDDAMLKTFFLKDPSRLVIDVYPKSDRGKKGEEVKNTLVTKKDDQREGQNANEMDGGHRPEQEGEIDKTKKNSTANSEAVDDALMKNSVDRNSGNDKIKKDAEDDEDFIPEKFYS